jgi:hypothetical protein
MVHSSGEPARHSLGGPDLLRGLGHSWPVMKVSEPTLPVVAVTVVQIGIVRVRVGERSVVMRV